MCTMFKWKQIVCYASHDEYTSDCTSIELELRQITCFAFNLIQIRHEKEVIRQNRYVGYT